MPPSGHGAPAESRRHVLGLHLMHLLVEARLGELHCEVEALHAGDAASPFIAYPLSLETWLVEGSYNKARLRVAAGACLPGRCRHTLVAASRAGD